jgi:hypothetical protein
LHLISSLIDVDLGTLASGESFRRTDSPQEKFEIIEKGSTNVVVRNIAGYVSRMNRSTKVRLESNLTRSPDGNQESRVVCKRKTIFLR